MKKLLFFSFCLTISFSMLNCSSSQPEEEKTEEERLKAAAEELSATSVETAASVMEQAAQSLRNLSANEDGETVEVVDFRKLKGVLPEKIAGLERTENDGQSTGAVGMKISTAQAQYEDGNRRLQITLTDAGGIPMLMMGLAQWTTAEIERESDNEYERTTTINGYKAFERYNKRNKEGQISFIVAERYIVNIEGDNIEESELRQAMKALDLDELENLR